MLKGLDGRYAEIRHGNNESTIFLSRKDFAKIGMMPDQSSGKADSAQRPGLLWDPIPITMPTYVSKTAGTADGSYDRLVGAGNVVLASA